VYDERVTACDEPLKLIDPNWYTSCVLSGFGSGEAIVGRIADPMRQPVRDKKTLTGFKDIVVPGESDKRLFIREGEAASVFQLAAKKDSRADISTNLIYAAFLVWRRGWDSNPR